MKTYQALLSVAALAFATNVAQAQSPDPNGAYIQSISYGGSGSPQGSVGSSFANDRESFTLIFDVFNASSGQGVPATESRKNSQINLNYRAAKPSKLDLNFRGYVNLPAGVTATITVATYDEKGNPKLSSETFQGPLAQDYLFSETVKLGSTKIGHGAGSAVGVRNLNVSIRVAGHQQASSLITIDSIDGQVWTAGDGKKE
ncbi:MAG TPA: DUF4360 domain-containing protein [Methylomirabilota bacterium]|nr:DUF4360 domain-containing protein [Methylomirabilota bacterium]